MNKNRSNLVLSLISLVITSFLLVFTVYSWYTSNQEVKASSIVGATDIEHATFDLERWNSSTSTWVSVSKIKEENVLPGKVMYLRLKCVNENESAITLNAKFEGIESLLNTNYVKISTDGLSVAYNGISVYTIANSKVTVNPVTIGSTSRSVLYNITNSKISLQDFVIHEGYVIENFGTTETTSGAINSIDNATSALKTLDEKVLDNQSIPAGTSYQYFALTYLDNDDVNNYYMYQELFIASLTITQSW